MIRVVKCPNRIGEIRGTIDLTSEQRYANPFGIVYAMTCISCILYHYDASSMWNAAIPGIQIFIKIAKLCQTLRTILLDTIKKSSSICLVMRLNEIPPLKYMHLVFI